MWHVPSTCTGVSIAGRDQTLAGVGQTRARGRAGPG